jgi:hypothetical protein
MKADIKSCTTLFSVATLSLVSYLVKVVFFPTLKRKRLHWQTVFSDESTFHVCVEQSAHTTVVYEELKILMILLNMSMSVCDMLWWKIKLMVLSFWRTYSDTFMAVTENNALHYVLVGTAFQSHGAPPNFSCCVCAFLDRVSWLLER